ncbi:Major facilitator superfamily [Trinorchestia longiramus]|nr:Major facilitator superfamily [Trinorchestia longiramus]
MAGNREELGHSSSSKSINFPIQSKNEKNICQYDDENLRIGSEASHTSQQGEFDWDSETQGYILGAFFYGYCLTNLIGGLLAERFGGRIVYGMGITLTAILTVISPLAARCSTHAFMFIRVLEGMTEGVTFPAMNVLMSHWVPAATRSGFFAFTTSGCIFGTIVTMSVTGVLCDSSWGWPSSFVLFGGLGLVWAVVWFACVTDVPVTGSINVDLDARKKSNVPWTHIMTSPPFLSVMVAHFCSNWGFYCLLTEMPSYLSSVLHFNLHTNGVVSSLPFVAKWFTLLTYPAYVDRQVVRGAVPLLKARRFSSFFGLLLPGLLLTTISLAGCNRSLVVVILILAVGLSGLDHAGHLCAFQELAPNFAGTLTGISNTVATLPGFLAPQLTGYLTKGKGLEGWETLFLVTFMLYVLGACVYASFVSVRVQSWNGPPSSRNIVTSPTHHSLLDPLITPLPPLKEV